MKAIELKERSNYFIKEGNESKQVTFVGMCGSSYRFYWMENGLEVYFQCDVDFIEKNIQTTQVIQKNLPVERKDKTGRNTLEVLKPYSGFSLMLDKGYRSCNINEKICIRSSFAGVVYPSLMIAEQLEFEKSL